ncbi:alanine--tRNA ligase [Vallitaleaceae bacterium 9-2]
MKSYGVNELRKMYLEFFESKGHLRADSFPLVPKNDKSLLLINSGMAPLKPYFTGQETPPKNRMTTCQKCIRTGDIENVGKTARHGTFFEMLGNFSFGDYFKKEAIAWAWEFFTQVLEIPKDILYVSVYEEDDEAEKIWHEQENVPMDRIVRMGKEDNFWEHGLGPCGPCSEIYVDRGKEYGCDDPNCTVGCECDRFVEIWNLVFTQFEKMENGDYVPLKNPNIDTGMGLERLAMMMQGVNSFFDVDTMQVIRDAICKKAKVTYLENKETDVSIRVITDHIRSVTFMTSDGILPSNEGRGYVLRRLLRRAARHGKLLGIQGAFLKELAQIVIESSKDGYPELKEKEAYILKVLTTEEERFAETIDQGIAILNTYLDELEDQTVLSGEKAFKLYDTYGFPLDLTIEIAEEKGVRVDQEAFAEEMKAQRDRARNAREESNYMGAEETVYHKLEIGIGEKFVGYQQLEMVSEITGLTQGNHVVTSISSGEKVSVIVHETPFYATSGGQQADIGYMETATGKVRIDDVINVVGNNIAHIGEVVEGDLEIGQEVRLSVDENHRFATAKNHSATHLLQKALKTVLGDHIEQAGSSVSADRLRFDFTHFEAIGKDDLKAVENLVNEQIQKGLSVHIEEMSIAQAKELGAMALFGEKYGETVRVVNIDGYSIELCGGTHLSNISEIGLFKIVSEGGVAAGVRRIEALTGQGAINYYHSIERTLNAVAEKARCEVGQVETKLQTLLDEIKELKRENEQLKSKAASSIVDDLLTDKISIGDIEIITAEVEGFDANRLRDLGDKLQEKLNQGVVVLASNNNGKVLLSVMASDFAVQKGAHAGKIISAIAKIVGGGGGGKPQIAQAGGKDTSKIAQALEKAVELLGEQVNA